ncbi:MAG: DUF2784 domain-containing protein [Gemmatimonadales bacterium]|nr:MAG: DUF2784 domain-containing protein [Gemmatimonadales bacterium]
MIYRILADLTLAVHLAFILFVVFGGLLVALRPRLAWIHVPTVLWGTSITLVGWRCPLTPLENHFRRLGGQAGVPDSFIEHYLVSIIYPQGIGPMGWTLLGVGVALINLAIYGWIWHRSRRAG